MIPKSAAELLESAAGYISSAYNDIRDRHIPATRCECGGYVPQRAVELAPTAHETRRRFFALPVIGREQIAFERRFHIQFLILGNTLSPLLLCGVISRHDPAEPCRETRRRRQFLFQLFAREITEAGEILPAGTQADNILYVVIGIQQLDNTPVAGGNVLFHLGYDSRSIESLGIRIESVFPQPSNESIIIFTEQHTRLIFCVQYLGDLVFQIFAQKRIEIGVGETDIESAVLLAYLESVTHLVRITYLHAG